MITILFSKCIALEGMTVIYTDEYLFRKPVNNDFNKLFKVSLARKAIIAINYMRWIVCSFFSHPHIELYLPSSLVLGKRLLDRRGSLDIH